MSFLVTLIGALLMLTCNPIGLLWGGIMILLSLPIWLKALIAYIWDLLIALITFDMISLPSILSTGFSWIFVLFLILILIAIGAQHGEH